MAKQQSIRQSLLPGAQRIKKGIKTITGRRYPKTGSALSASELFNQWWYYSVELLPGLITKGQYEDTIPMLPRLLLRNCKLEGMECLDLGTMEGLVPTLMARGGARRVLAVDAIDHCVEKMEAVQHYHKVRFDYRSVGLMYELDKKLPGQSFDLINCSGLLYHVISPLTVLASLRPLIKRQGLVIISTNVAHTDEFVMDFNNAGRLQDEINTFWYLSIPLLDYLLRYLSLAPIDLVYLPHANISSHIRYITEKPSGYMSIVCRAVDEPAAADSDQWMRNSAARSWEYVGLYDSKRAASNPSSAIKYTTELREFFRSDIESVDLWRAVRERTALDKAQNSAEAHILKIEHQR